MSLPTFCIHIYIFFFFLNYEFIENGVWIFSRCFCLCICTLQNSWHVGKCFVPNWLKTFQLSGQWRTWTEYGWIYKWMVKWRLLCLENVHRNYLFKLKIFKDNSHHHLLGIQKKEFKHGVSERPSWLCRLLSSWEFLILFAIYGKKGCGLSVGDVGRYILGWQ